MSRGKESRESRVLVSVLIPTLNEAAHIKGAIEMVRTQNLQDQAEFIFIDGCSEDGTKAVLERAGKDDSRIRVLDNPARFIPNALNVGLRAATGEFVARMDAHTRYPSDYLSRGIRRLRQGGVDWVSGPQLPEGVGPWSRRIALALGTSLGIGGASFRRLPASEIETDTGFTGVWRRRTLEEHGGWDESWQINEDSELAARVRAAGGCIVCLPEMAGKYIPRESLGALALQYWRYGRFRAVTCRAHPQSMRRSHLVPPAQVLATAAALLGGSGPLGRAGRRVTAVYALAVAATAIRELVDTKSPDAVWVPLVLVTMHHAWGAGFLASCVEGGPPVSGAIHALKG